MKKLFFLNLALFSIFVITSFISCSDPDEEPIKRPYIELDKANKQINLSIIAPEDVDYINILRKSFTVNTDHTKIDEESYSKEINIGQICINTTQYPSVTFKDDLIVKGTYYTYRARFHYKSGKYEYSSWTTWPQEEYGDDSKFKDATAPDVFNVGYASDDDLKPNTVNNSDPTKPIYYFCFDENELELLSEKDSSDNNLAEDDQPLASETNFDNYKICIVVSYGEKKRPFTIEEYFTEKKLKLGTKISINKCLSEDFLNRDIKIEGLLFEKIEEDVDQKKIDIIKWSQLAPINVRVKNKDDTEGELVETIFIKSNIIDSTNHDYSNKR